MGKSGIAMVVAAAMLALPTCSNPAHSKACKDWQKDVFTMQAILVGGPYSEGPDQALRDAVAAFLSQRPDGCPIPGR